MSYRRAIVLIFVPQLSKAYLGGSGVKASYGLQTIDTAAICVESRNVSIAAM